MMFNPYVITTVNQKVLSLLAKFSDKEFYERQVARKINISYGSANRALNELYSAGVVRRRREGKMYFYSVDASNAIVTEFKKLVNLTLIEPLIENIKNDSVRVVLYGSCARGEDTSKSDLDLLIVSANRERVAEAISTFSFPQGFEDIHIQAVIKTTVELLEVGESEKAFLEEVERGIVLWESLANEPRF